MVLLPALLPPVARGHLGMSGDTFRYQKFGGVGATSIWCVEARDAAK